MKIILMLSAAILTCCTAIAQVTQTPYSDYLAPLLDRETQAAPDVWSETGSGGYLFRFWLDVNGDGKKELFLTSSLEAYKLSANWTVYTPQESGKYLRYLGSVKTSMKQIAIKKSGQAVTFVSWGQDQTKYYLTTYHFSGSKILSETVNISGEKYDSLEAGNDVESFVPALEAVHIMDFLKNPTITWMKVNMDSLTINSAGYLKIPKDSKRIERLQATPMEAHKLLERIR